MLLVDISMLMYRCWSKLNHFKTTTNIHTGLEYGTLNSLESLGRKYPDQEIILCFDSPNNHRKRQHPEYKADRKPWSDDLKKRMVEYKQFLTSIYRWCEYLGSEADDLMYALSKKFRGPHYLYTNDQDLLQGVSDNRKVMLLKSFKRQLYEWDEAKVVEKFGVLPENLPIYRAFVGDVSDNLKGVPRINRKLLALLIEWCTKQHLDQLTMLEEIRSGDWSDSVRKEVEDFIDSGKWLKNYDLMRLKQNDTLMIFSPGIHVEKTIVRGLNKWEIRSLEICKKYKTQLVDTLSEEF